MKITGSGNTIWSKTIDFGGVDYVSSLQETLAHEIIISGYMGLSAQSDFKIEVVKLDSMGNLSWSKTYLGPGYYNNATVLKQTPDGRMIMLGNTASINHSFTNAFLTKLSSDGTILWAKTPVLSPSSYSSAMELRVL
jgi:hypothetical protein